MSFFSRWRSHAGHEDSFPFPPAPPYEGLSAERQNLLKQRFLRQITRESAPEPSPVRPVRPRRYRPAALVAVPALLVAALAMVTSLTGAFRGSAADHHEAVRLLDRIAVVAAERPARTVRDEQYVYTRIKGSWPVPDEGTDVFIREDWIAVDGERNGLARQVYEPGSPSLDSRPPDGGTVLDKDLTMTTYRELEALPTDPDALLEKIEKDTEGQGPASGQAVFEAIAEMLPQSTLRPELNAALYRATARIPGVVVRKGAIDAAGRYGIGLAFHTDGDDVVWVFDKDRLTYLGTNKVALLDVGIADATDQRPLSR
ncbi:CU044_5270 family protein [Streptomyces sp. 35G-GA-8]|uniref:CU044_5270 family protein n=1 Tax=Streptomyces sp. 35G-GA-8 TaxID=2939434 RepID=UPI00201E94DD|nr:CU044_5270 family protein [Streptomyces sp. 35G-GA-8]MCL7378469.1 CU044_5270 family protein [Streptomyces sp. 35G-GA-8]